MSEEGIPAVNGSEWDFLPATSLPSSRRVVPVIGYPGPLFAAIHLSALVVLSLSTIVSVGLFVFLCGCQCSCRSSTTKKYSSATDDTTTVKGVREGNNGKEDGREGRGGNRKEVNYDPSSGAFTGASAIGKRDPVTMTSKGNRATGGDGGHNHQQQQQQQQQQHIRNFWKWNVGERFVLYLGMCDIGLGISHFFDHAYMYYTKENPPDLLCAFFAFFLHEFSVAQWFVVLLSAGSACSLVVFGKKFSLGRWDWKLFLFAFAVPFVVGAFGIKYEMLGASGAWCYMNAATDAGIHYNQVFTCFQVALYGVVALSYGAIWLKIQRTARLMKGSSSTGRYQNSARVMMIFVAVFIFQWWSLTLFNVWVLVSTQVPAPVLVLAVILINLGGVYNCLAYTIVRRRLQSQAKQANRVVVSGGGGAAAAGETGGRPGPAAAASAASADGRTLGRASSSASDNGSQSSKSPLVEMHI